MSGARLVLRLASLVEPALAGAGLTQLGQLLPDVLQHGHEVGQRLAQRRGRERVRDGVGEVLADQLDARGQGVEAALRGLDFGLDGGCDAGHGDSPW